VPHPCSAPPTARRLGAGLAFVVAAAVAGPAAADGAATVTRWYDELGKVDGVTVRHGAITDEAGGKTIARDIEVRFATSLRVGITDLIDPIVLSLEGTWSMPAFMATDLVENADGYRAAAIEVPEQSLALKLTAAGSSIDVKATMTETTMRGGAWPRLPEVADDPARPVSRFGPVVEAALGQSWAEQAVGTVEFVLEAPGMKQVSRYGPSRATGLVNGRLAELVVENSETTQTITLPGEAGAAPTSTVEHWRVRRSAQTGYDFLPAVRAFFGLRQASAKAIILETDTTEGIVSDGTGAKVSVARSEVRGLSIGTPAIPLATLYDRLFVDGTVAADVLVDTVLATVETIGVDESTTTGIAFDGMEDASTGTSFDVKGRIAEIRMDGWAGFTVNGISVGGVDATVPDAGTVAFDRFALGDLSFPSRAAIVAAVRVGLAAEAAEKAAPKPAPGSDGTDADPDMDGAAPDDTDPGGATDGGAGDPAIPELSTRQILDLVPTLGAIELSGLKVTQPGEPPVSLGAFRALFAGYVAPVPTDIRITVVDLHIPKKLVDDADIEDALARFGADAIDFDATLALRWDEASGDYTLDPFEVAVDRIGRYTNRFKLGNVPRSVFADPENAQAALPLITFQSSSSSLSDASGLSDYIASLAREAGVSPGDIIAGFAEETRQSLAGDTGDAFAGKAAEAVRAFLSDPTGALVIAARPAAPVPLAAVLGSATMSPGSLVGLLNVTIEAVRRL